MSLFGTPSRSGRAGAWALLALALAAAPAQAQSLFSNRGLGLVVSPTDARGLALGGIGLGLAGNELSWQNPAGAVGLPAPGLGVVYQFDEFSAEFGGRSAEGSTARFPLIVGGVPISERWAVTAGVGGFLDQNWAVERSDTLLVGPDTVPVLDQVTSEGGVVRARVGAGYRVVDGLAVGLGADFFLGGVEQSRGRLFPGQARPACCRSDWTYSGVGTVGGVDWQPTGAVRLAASFTYGGTLRASAEDSLSADAEYDLPATVSLGASGRVAGDLVLALGADWAGWSSLDGALADVGGAQDTWAVSGGAEYEGLRILDRPVPLRLGARRAGLPFGWGGPDEEPQWATERAVTGGLGLVLGGGATRVDLAVERGSRGGDGAGVEESFWRTVFSISVFGR